MTDTLTGRRDRALIALMTYAFARVGAVLKRRAEDVFIQGRRMRWASTASFRLWWPHYEWPGAAKLLIPFRFVPFPVVDAGQGCEVPPSWRRRL